MKPQNILLHSSGRVKLTDFGIAKELDSSIGTYVCMYVCIPLAMNHHCKFSYCLRRDGADVCRHIQVHVPWTNSIRSLQVRFWGLGGGLWILIIRFFTICHSAKSDVWSLGLMLIECATGSYPYTKCNSHIEVSISKKYGTSQSNNLQFRSLCKQS